MKKTRILVLAMTVIITLATSCGKKGKEESTKEQNEGIKSGNQVVTNKEVENKLDKIVYVGSIEDEISYEAARLMAEAKEIPFSNEVLNAYYETNFEKQDNPKSKKELSYSMTMFEKVCGRDAVLKKIAPSYVDFAVREKLLRLKVNEDMDKEIENNLINYKEYMDSLGIVESARKEYLKGLLVNNEVEFEISELYEQSFVQASYNVYKKLIPDYVDSLNLQ